MWNEYPAAVALFSLSSLVLLVGVWIDEQRGKKACDEQQARLDAIGGM